MGVLNHQSNLGVNGFDLSKASAVSVGDPFPLENFSTGSIQITWSGATSSDAFTSLGTFEFKVSNDNVNWFTLSTPATITINAATGSKLFTLPVSLPYTYGKLEWTKNNSTGGTAKCFAIFKNHQ